MRDTARLLVCVCVLNYDEVGKEKKKGEGGRGRGG